MSDARDVLSMEAALAPVRAVSRAQDVVVTTMSAAKVWMDMGPLHPLDHVFVPSCMGHATSVALGIALAQPQRRVIVCNGDGSMLMNLGSLVTIAGQAPRNLVVIVVVNGVYEVTGSQPMPGRADFATIARGSGITEVHHLSSASAWADAAPDLLTRAGPVCIVLDVLADTARPAPKSPGPAGTRASALKAALAGGS